MNNKDFTSELSRRLGYTIKDTSELMSSLLSDMTQELQEGNVVTIQGFGTFEVKETKVRKITDPRGSSEPIISKPRKYVKFKASKNLEERMKKK